MVRVLTCVGVADIACGAKHGLALVDVPGEGLKLYAFGCGDHGQLANGLRQDQTSPTPATTALATFTSIAPHAFSAGKAHTLALL
jgi:alpha-tubulin suppressor-like RCC1 family protein